MVGSPPMLRPMPSSPRQHRNVSRNFLDRQQMVDITMVDRSFPMPPSKSYNGTHGTAPPPPLETAKTQLDQDLQVQQMKGELLAKVEDLENRLTRSIKENHVLQGKLDIAAKK